MTSGKTLWFEFPLQSETWSVYLVDPIEYGEMDNNEGLCLNERAQIYISTRVAPSRVGAVFFHEWRHAVNWAAAFEKQTKYILGLDKPMENDQEEALVCLTAPIEFDSLLRGNLIHLPPLPERI